MGRLREARPRRLHRHGHRGARSRHELTSAPAGVASTPHGTAPLDDAEENDHDRDDEQDVDEPACCIRGDVPEEPEDEENSDNGHQHESQCRRRPRPALSLIGHSPHMRSSEYREW